MFTYMECKRFVVCGRVQGVFYRASTQQQARDLGLTGWVRNCHDGSVELVACGDTERLHKLEAWLWQGPSHATVSAVAVEPTTGEQFASFEMRYE
jgi:acylphosphatase